MRCEIAARTVEGCAHLLYHNMTTPNFNSCHKAWSMPRAGHEVFVEAREKDGIVEFVIIHPKRSPLLFSLSLRAALWFMHI